MTETIFAPGAGAASASMPDAGRSVDPQDYVSDEADRKKADFENLIRGEYKQAFDQKVQKIIDKRFRDMRILREQFARIKPVLDALNEKYGVTDAQTLVKMLKEDASGTDRADIERRRNAAMKVMKWRREADDLLRMHPGFRLETEMKNTVFTGLLKAGIDMKTAYNALHQDEILDYAVRYAVKKARDKTIKEMRLHAQRPEENGAGGRGGAKMAPIGVNNMTRAEREEIERRCARGEKVYFS